MNFVYFESVKNKLRIWQFTFPCYLGSMLMICYGVLEKTPWQLGRTVFPENPWLAFHYTGWLIGILIMVCLKSRIYPKQPCSFFIAQMKTPKKEHWTYKSTTGFRSFPGWCVRVSSSRTTGFVRKLPTSSDWHKKPMKGSVKCSLQKTNTKHFE